MGGTRRRKGGSKVSGGDRDREASAPGKGQARWGGSAGTVATLVVRSAAAFLLLQATVVHPLLWTPALANAAAETVWGEAWARYVVFFFIRYDQ